MSSFRRRVHRRIRIRIAAPTSPAIRPGAIQLSGGNNDLHTDDVVMSGHGNLCPRGDRRYRPLRPDSGRGLSHARGARRSSTKCGGGLGHILCRGSRHVNESRRGRRRSRSLLLRRCSFRPIGARQVEEGPRLPWTGIAFGFQTLKLDAGPHRQSWNSVCICNSAPSVRTGMAASLMNERSYNMLSRLTLSGIWVARGERPWNWRIIP